MKKRVYFSLFVSLVIVIAAISIRYGFFDNQKPTDTKNSLGIATSSQNVWIDNSDTIEKIEDILKKPIETAINEASSESDSKTTKPATETTATDRLAQELFIKYVEISKAGVTIDDEISSKLAESLLLNDYSEPENLYIASDLKKINNPTTSTIKKYANDLALILSTPSTGYQSEIEILTKIADEPIERYITELTAQKTRYAGIRAKLIALAAPEQLTRAQADIINSITLFMGAIDGALSIETDPVGAVTKIGSYDNGLKLLSGALEDYKRYLNTNRITFSPNETGSLLLE